MSKYKLKILILLWRNTRIQNGRINFGTNTLYQNFRCVLRLDIAKMDCPGTRNIALSHTHQVVPSKQNTDSAHQAIFDMWWLWSSEILNSRLRNRPFCAQLKVVCSCFGWAGVRWLSSTFPRVWANIFWSCQVWNFWSKGLPSSSRSEYWRNTVFPLPVLVTVLYMKTEQLVLSAQDV